MKKQILMLTVFVFAYVLMYAQIPSSKCGSMEYLQKQKELDPNLETKMIIQEQNLQQWINENYQANSKEIITIPVVVHIVYNTEEQNIPDLNVFEQIELSNRDYAGLNTHSMEAFSSSLKDNTGIQFCLAQKAPDGSPTSGIERRYTTVTSFTFDNAVKHYSTGGWDPQKYFNIWVCNLADYTGYGQFPGAGINDTYGLVVKYWAFGSTGTIPTRNNGGCSTHEIGHCLNLWHIWGDDNGACTGSDYCSDTPDQANSTTGINTGVVTDACSSSSPGIMYMNFMDYSDDSVFANFTPNQTARIQALFASPSGLLLSLATSDGCSSASTCTVPIGLNATSITKSSAVLGWTAMYGAVSYNIRYKKVGTSTWTSTTSSTNSKSINGLARNTSYEFQVQTVCASGTSDYSSSETFVTLKKSEDNTTGIAESNNTFSEFNLFPNPAKEQVNINYFTNNAQNAEVKLIDITGRVIKSENFATNQGENNYTLDLNMVNKGLYFVEFSIIGQEKIVNKLLVE